MQILVSLSTLLLLFSIISAAAGSQCPDTAASRFCCTQVQLKPLEGLPVSQDGYGWYPSDGRGAGLCQGLAAARTAAVTVAVVSLTEETIIPVYPPARVEIAYRSFQSPAPERVVFRGEPLPRNNSFRMAGEFLEDHVVTWDTRTFRRLGLTPQNYGFVATARIAGRDLLTPIVLLPGGQRLRPRSKATLVLRASRTLSSFKATVRSIRFEDGFLLGDEMIESFGGETHGTLLRLALKEDLPELFRIEVRLCGASDASCPEDAPPHRFEIYWPKA